MKEALTEEIELFKSEFLGEKEKIAISKKIVSKLNNKLIIIYGAGASGKIICKVLQQSGVVIEGFVDKKYDQIKEVNGIAVWPPERLKEYRRNNVVIIVAIDPQIFKNFVVEVKENIERLCPECEWVSYGRDILPIFTYSHCKEKLIQGKEFDIVDCINCGAECRGCNVFMEYLKKIGNKSEVNNKLSVEYNQYFGYILGKRCTLKCKYCCELLPYHRERDVVDKDTVIKDCTMLASAAEFHMYIELVGGEPFLHPEITEILKELLLIKNVGYIKIFTNGTVVPNKELIKVLKNPRIVLVWSNYMDVVKGNLLENINETRQKLEEANIEYISSYSQTWLDFSTGFDDVHKTLAQLEKDFEDCHIADCYRLYRGTLYRCPHQYAAVELGKMKVDDKECVKLYKETNIEQLSKSYQDFIKLPYVDVCKYCTLPYDAKEVPAGEQL